MPQSVSPQDLFNPGAVEEYFRFAPAVAFEPGQTTVFSRSNALWLAEFARLIYRRGADELALPAGWRTRDAILTEHGWRETHCLAQGSTRAAVFANDALRTACVVFRGTLDPADVLCDLQLRAVRWNRREVDTGYVHQGFKEAFKRIWRHLETVWRSLPYPTFLTGHSLGAALATLAAARLLHTPGLARPAALYTYGSPRTGDAAFGRQLAGLFHCRIVNGHDLIASVPPAFSLPGLPVYQHTGQLHRLLPEGGIELAPDGFDVDVRESVLPGLRDFSANVGRLFERAKASGILPQNLLDHAPMNYVARLEELP